MRLTEIPNLVHAGTGSPEGKIAATVGTVYTDTAATNGAIRWIKTSGTGTTGWSVKYGDTGWRDVTTAFNVVGDIGDSGGVHIRRVGDTVTLRLVGPLYANDRGTFEVRDISGRFAPTLILYPPMTTFTGTYNPQITPYHFQLHGQPAGKLIVHDMGAVEFTWTTVTSWPTGLPGNPV